MDTKENTRIFLWTIIVSPLCLFSWMFTVKLERFGVLDEIAEKNKIMLDFDYTTRRSTQNYSPRWGAVRDGRRVFRSSAQASSARIAGPSLIPIFRNLRIIGLRFREVYYRRTRKGWHVVFFCSCKRKLSPAEIVAIQFCLRSDERRETLNLMRVLTRKKNNNWNLLFSEKLL